jgi:Domain of unknown function (DUF4160)
MDTENYLLDLCAAIYKAENMAQAERKKEFSGGNYYPEFFIMRQDKVRVEIRKENVKHNEPHIHVTHSDKIDVSISIMDFRILAGEIDKKTYKHIVFVLFPKKDKLIKIWKELNEKENSIGVEKLISNLDF